MAFTRALSKGVVTSYRGQEGIKSLSNFSDPNTKIKYSHELKTAPQIEHGSKRLYGNVETVNLPAKRGCKPVPQKTIVFTLTDRVINYDK